MEKFENSAETFQANSSLKNETKFQESINGIKEFNNVETADRKLIVNDGALEFWIHDEILTSVSDYFADLFQEDKEGVGSNLDSLHLTTQIYLKNSHNVFLDLLLWTYTRNILRLKKYFKNFNELIKLLVLAVELKYRKKFYAMLFSNIQFVWKIQHFKNTLWSRNYFSFEILSSLITNMVSLDCFTRVFAALAWLYNNVNEPLNDCQFLEDSHFVKELLLRQELVERLSYKELLEVYKEFELGSKDVTLALSNTTVINNFVFIKSQKLQCLACKKEFTSIYSAFENKECKAEYYHPRIGRSQGECQHDGCNIKLAKSFSESYPCCHRNSNNSLDKKGCIATEGKHIFVFN